MPKKISQPDISAQQQLNDLLENKVSFVDVRDKTWKVRWKTKQSLRKVTDKLLDEKENEDKVVCKCVALLRLENWWKQKLFYWILWRWYYYVREYTDEELLPYIEECKKKVPVESYFGCIMLLTAMKDTMMMMTRKEVNHIQAEQLMAQRGALEKNGKA